MYVKGDTGFNESFATAVEEVGIERFLLNKGMSDALQVYEDGKSLRRRLMKIMHAARIELGDWYARDMSDDDKRKGKQSRIEQLREALDVELTASGRTSSGWPGEPLNNARIASLALYEGRLPEFRLMLEQCDYDIECFYDEARRVARLDQSARNER